jgi:tetratricopeptide (TPR) repeat protein
MRPGEIAADDHPLVRMSRERPEIIICEGVLPDVLDQLASACGVTYAIIDASERADAIQESIAWTPPQGAWAGHLFSKVFKHVAAFDQELACYRWEARQALTYPGPHRTAWAIEGLAVWYLAHGHRELARSLLWALYELLEITGDTHAQHRIRRAFGQLYRRYPPNSADRQDYARRLLSLAEQVRDASVLNSVGLQQYEENAHSNAIATFEKALEIIGDGNTGLRATVLGNLALAQSKLGDSRSAVSNFSRALEIEDAIGNREGVIYQLRNLGHLYVELGQHGSAIQPLQRATDLEKGIASAQTRAETLGLLGDALAAVNRVDDAHEAYRRAATAARESDDPYVWNALHNYILKKAAKLHNPTGHGKPK